MDDLRSKQAETEGLLLDFMSGLGLRLKKDLSIVQPLVEVLRDELTGDLYKGPSKHAEMFNSVERTLHRIDDLLNQFVFLMEIQDPGYKMNDLTDMQALVRSAFQKSRFGAQDPARRPARVCETFGGFSTRIKVNFLGLRQAVIDIFSLAYDVLATPREEDEDLARGPDLDKSLKIETSSLPGPEPGKNTFQLSFSLAGIGPLDEKAVFSPFGPLWGFYSHMGPDPDEHSPGLFRAKMIVERHGGVLKARDMAEEREGEKGIRLLLELSYEEGRPPVAPTDLATV